MAFYSTMTLHPNNESEKMIMQMRLILNIILCITYCFFRYMSLWMFKTRYTTIIAMLSSAIFYTGVAAEEEETKEIEHLVVQAEYLSIDKANSIKTPTPIIDIPQSLSITTAEEMTQLGVRDISDIVQYTPGVNMSQGEGHRDAVVFRGIRSTADFFIDGVRDDVQYYRPLYNLEQVEILRGPNALLFGRGGSGGVLNRVTKKAEIGEQFLGYKGTADTFAEHVIELDGNYSINDRVAFRINAMYEGLENHRDFYDGERFGFNPTFKFKITSDTTLDISYEYIKHERFIDRGIPTGANGEPVEAFEDIVFADPDLNKTELEAHVFRAAIEHSFTENLKGNFSAFYGDYDKFYQNFYASDFDPTTNIVELDGYVDTTDRQNLMFSGNLVGEFDTKGIGHTVLFGGEYIDTSSDQDRFNATWLPDGNADSDTELFTVMRPLNIRGGIGINSADTPIVNDFTADLNDDTRVDIDVYSVYIQDQIELSPLFDVVFGLRYDNFEIEVNNVEPGASFGIRTSRDDRVSPRAGLIFKPWEDISFYASYSESFLPRSGEQYADINNAEDLLDADEFETRELGVKWDFAALSLTAALFQNEQTIADRDNMTGETFEVRGLSVDGLEISLEGQLIENLYISTGYTYLDGKTSSGAEPRELPENMFSFWGQYRFTPKFGLGLGFVYQDNSLITDGGSTLLPSYTRVDAAAYYDLSAKLRLQVNVENLTNELYFPNAHSTHQATVGKPINAMFTIRGQF